MAQLDPYAPPSIASERDRPEPIDADVRPVGGIATVLIVLLAAHVVIAALGMFGQLGQIELLERMNTGNFTMQEAEDNDARIGMLAIVYLGLLCGTGVLTCVWFHRMNKNARALGAEYMSYGPHGWGWFFCPVLNLWRPLVAFKELWTASQDPTRVAEPPGYFNLWWAGWIALSVLGNVQRRMFDTEDIASLVRASQVAVVTEVVTVVAAIGLLFVIRGTTRIQTARMHELSGVRS